MGGVDAVACASHDGIGNNGMVGVGNMGWIVVAGRCRHRRGGAGGAGDYVRCVGVGPIGEEPSVDVHHVGGGVSGSGVRERWMGGVGRCCRRNRRRNVRDPLWCWEGWDGWRR